MFRDRMFVLVASLAGLTSVASARAEDPPPVETPQATLGAPIAVEAEPEPATVTPRYSLRREFGDGVGFDGGYTYFETFLPVWQTPGQNILFANLRAINYDDDRYWEAQVGGGARGRLFDTIVGVNAFYDGRNTDVRYYNQAGVGLELLRRNWELRSNVYIPVGGRRSQVGDTGFYNPQFVNTNISLDRTITEESSMGGFDVELGRLLPSWFDLARTSAYVGFYHYDAPGMQSANGVRGRLESWIGENVSLNLQVENDAVTNTTVSGGVAFHWGGVSRAARQADPLAAKLGDRVVRAPDIITQQKSDTSRELAIDPVTGLPIEVRHVDSNAAAGGDGSVLHPFQTLAQLQAGSGPNQILFAHADSVFIDQNIHLQPNQRFLGEGIDHYFTAVQGTFLLPRATTGRNSPLIYDSDFGPFVSVILANNTEVAGFRIDQANGIGILGRNVSGVTIDRNQIVSSSPLGNLASIQLLYFRSSGGSANIDGNTVNSGINVYQIASNVSVAINHNTVENDGDNFGIIQVFAFGRGTGNYQIDGNVATGDNIPLVAVEARGRGTLVNLQLADNAGTPSVFGSPFQFLAANHAILNVEDTLETNSEFPDDTHFAHGRIRIVPVGTAGFGPPP
jgi:trimeric autotransporter adhesin